jgi:nucleoside 2-deoxyribosyltransferase
MAKGGVIMVKSARIQEIICKLLSDNKKHKVQEIKAYLAANELGGGYSEGQFAGSLRTLQRNGTIKRAERGAYILVLKEERKRSTASTVSAGVKTCFVVFPIGNVGSETRDEADKLFKYVVKPVCDHCGFEAVRADQLNDADSITQKMINKLETADLVIADVSECNPNVFYEIGFRARANKPVIYLKKQGGALPFDIKTIRAFEYDLSDLDSVAEVKERLEQTIQSFTYPSSDGVSNDGDVQAEKLLLPVLYQILDAIAELNNNNKGIVKAVTQAAQNARPADTALQMLISAAFQNPETLKAIMDINR